MTAREKMRLLREIQTQIRRLKDNLPSASFELSEVLRALISTEMGLKVAIFDEEDR